MRGVVVEIEGNEMIVVDKEGHFKKLKYVEGYRIGQEIDLRIIPMAKYKPIVQRMAAVAAIFIIVLGFGLYSYYSPYSYISMDINPSVEIVLNRYERVLDVQPLNDDGKIIVNQQYKFMHKQVDEVISQLIDNAHQKNYLKNGIDNEIFITVSAPKAKVAQKIGQYVQEYAAAEVTQNHIEANIAVESVTIQKHIQASKEHISAGKLLLLEQLQQVLPTATIDDIKGKSVKDIIQNIKEEKDKAKGKNLDLDSEKEKGENKEYDKEKDKEKDEKKDGQKHLEIDKAKDDSVKDRDKEKDKKKYTEKVEEKERDKNKEKNEEKDNKKDFQNQQIQKKDEKQHSEKKSDGKTGAFTTVDAPIGRDDDKEIQKQKDSHRLDDSESKEESNIQEDIYEDIDVDKNRDRDKPKKEGSGKSKRENSENDDHSQKRENSVPQDVGNKHKKENDKGNKKFQ